MLSQGVLKALVLDHDDNIAIPERNANGNYIIQEDGSINATIIDKELLTEVHNVGIKNNIPFEIITARHDIPGNRKVVEKTVEDAGGFQDQLGGFKKESIHFVGIKIDGKHELICTKLEKLQALHKEKYPHLKPGDFLYFDDEEKHLNPIKQAGYMTVLAKRGNKDHFNAMLEFVRTRGYTPRLFQEENKKIMVENKSLKLPS